MSLVLTKSRNMQVPVYTMTELEDGLEEKIQIVVRLPGMTPSQVLFITLLIDIRLSCRLYLQAGAQYQS